MSLVCFLPFEELLNPAYLATAGFDAIEFKHKLCVPYVAESSKYFISLAQCYDPSKIALFNTDGDFQFANNEIRMKVDKISEEDAIKAKYAFPSLFEANKNKAFSFYLALNKTKIMFYVGNIENKQVLEVVDFAVKNKISANKMPEIKYYEPGFKSFLDPSITIPF